MTNTFVQQVGGKHYGGHANQHWDLMSRFDIEYLPATASKYVMRWDEKGKPIEDLEKSISYLDKQLKNWPTIGCHRLVPWESMQVFFDDNHLSSGNPVHVEKRMLLELIHVEGTATNLSTAIILLGQMIQREKVKPIASA